MTFEQEQLAELESQCEEIQVMSEGESSYVLLLRLKIRSGEEEHVMDALLCPGPHTGYATRLFLERPIPNRGQNWTVHNILAKNWHTWSWKDVQPSQRLAQILVGHLSALI